MTLKTMPGLCRPTESQQSAGVHNFSGGPGALPEPVLAATQQAIVEVPGQRLSVLGISHRSDWFRGVLDEAESHIRSLLGLSDDYHVLFLQGGSTLQFSMIPITLANFGPAAPQYLHTGYWSGKSIVEARRSQPIDVLWSGETDRFVGLPTSEELEFNPDAAYFHYISNETVEGLQFPNLMGREDVLRVCDMSSDFLSAPLEANRFGLIYAHAQKNLGPSGVTVVIIRRELLSGISDDVPAMLDYRKHAAARSIYNTPPVFAIYVTMLVLRWLAKDIGGLEKMASMNHTKATKLYATIDGSGGFYRGRASYENRSLMNVVFELPSADLQSKFLSEATHAGFYGLEGHRTLGGIRASIYNAVTENSVNALCEFMDDFRHRCGSACT